MLHAIYSRPEAERTGTHLVILFHGYGSREEHMIPWFSALPGDATGVALRGGLDMDGEYGWFLLDYFLANDFAEVLSGAGRVFDWQDANATGYASISLLGHSQGMAMASTLQRLRPGSYRAVVGLSGFVLDNELLNLTDTVPGDRAEAIPFFWGRDPMDPVINADALEHTADWLSANSRLTARSYPGMGHGFGPEEQRDVAAFLNHYLR
ncbi:alpha/beta hydrolase [Paeniglutamicibacter cryotolerans]|uniref:Phospholipase/carboxylesterase n=1 Tax=Paeniglutamicibacter cryotolerans TaxID=670079 RepID=A0A839QFK0_9MICC|nr:phospholipase [Paeniglutamicibacter cryotolerans]MBB2995058.1 phospholipase/carboxylesterase [Paeniglutamicibacter cryotolerans]